MPNQSTQPTVYVVDGHTAFQQDIMAALSGHELRGHSVDSVRQFLQWELSRPCCILLDLRQHSVRAQTILQQLHHRGDHVPVIILTEHAELAAVVQSMQMGAMMVLQEPFSTAQLVEHCANAIALDRIQMQEDLQYRTVDASLKLLSERQKSVLNLVLEGRPNRDIATQLNVSQRTIESERSALLRVFDANSITDVAQRIGAYKILNQRRMRLDAAHSSYAPSNTRRSSVQPC